MTRATTLYYARYWPHGAGSVVHATGRPACEYLAWRTRAERDRWVAAAPVQYPGARGYRDAVSASDRHLRHELPTELDRLRALDAGRHLERET